GESGSVAFRFRPVGLLQIEKSAADEETLFNTVIEAGAEDVRTDEEVDGNYEVVTDPENFGAVRQALEDAKIPLANAAYTLEPTDTVQLDARDAALMLRL